MTDESEKIVKLFGDLDNIKLQIGRLVSDAESEKDARARTTEHIIGQIEKVETEIKDILQGKDRISGLVVRVDRLEQMRNLIVFFASVSVTALVGLIGKIIYDQIKK